MWRNRMKHVCVTPSRSRSQSPCIFFYSNKTLVFQTQPQRQDLMFNTHGLMDFFNIKQSLQKIFSTFYICNPISTGTLAAGGSEGQLELPVGITGHRRRAAAWEWLHSHTQEYSPTDQPHHTHNTDADVYPGSATAKVCSTLGKPNM